MKVINLARYWIGWVHTSANSPCVKPYLNQHQIIRNQGFHNPWIIPRENRAKKKGSQSGGAREENSY